MHADSIKAKA